MRTPKQIKQEALEAFARDPTTPEQHFQQMIDAGFINSKGQVTTLLGGSVDPEPGVLPPKFQNPDNSWASQKAVSCWHPAQDPLPALEVGDRVLIVVDELPFREARYSVKTIVILVATETGWDSPDPVYGGYSVEDGIVWALERDILESLDPNPGIELAKARARIEELEAELESEKRVMCRVLEHPHNY